VSYRFYIDKEGQEWIFEPADDRAACKHNCPCKYSFIAVDPGTIKLLTHRDPIPGNIYKAHRNEIDPTEQRFPSKKK